MEMKDSPLYIVNGLLLIIVFGSVRIVFGVTASLLFWSDTLAAMGRLPVPIYLWYMTSNICLNCLNFFWFYKIIRAAMKVMSTKSSGKQARKE